MKFLSIFHSVAFLLISFNLLLVINTIQLYQFMYRAPILESKQNSVLSNNYINFSSDRIIPSEGTTYKKAIILGFNDDLNDTKKNNKTSFSFKEFEKKKEIVEVNVKDNMSKKDKIENQLVKNLSHMIKDVISSFYIKDTNRTEVLNKTIDNYKNNGEIIPDDENKNSFFKKYFIYIIIGSVLIAGGVITIVIVNRKRSEI